MADVQQLVRKDDVEVLGCQIAGDRRGKDDNRPQCADGERTGALARHENGDVSPDAEGNTDAARGVADVPGSDIATAAQPSDRHQVAQKRESEKRNARNIDDRRDRYRAARAGSP